MPTDFFLERHLTSLSTGSVRTSRDFHHKSLRFLIDFFLEIFVDLPDEVWLIIVKKMELIDIFNFSILSKRFYCISRNYKFFVDSMRVSKHIFGFDAEYQNFLSEELQNLNLPDTCFFLKICLRRTSLFLIL